MGRLLRTAVLTVTGGAADASTVDSLLVLMRSLPAPEGPRALLAAVKVITSQQHPKINTDTVSTVINERVCRETVETLQHTDTNLVRETRTSAKVGNLQPSGMGECS